MYKEWECRVGAIHFAPRGWVVYPLSFLWQRAYLLPSISQGIWRVGPFPAVLWGVWKEQGRECRERRSGWQKPRGGCSAGCSGILRDLGRNCTCSAKWTLVQSLSGRQRGISLSRSRILLTFGRLCRQKCLQLFSEANRVRFQQNCRYFAGWLGSFVSLVFSTEICTELYCQQSLCLNRCK